VSKSFIFPLKSRLVGIISYAYPNFQINDIYTTIFLQYSLSYLHYVFTFTFIVLSFHCF